MHGIDQGLWERPSRLAVFHLARFFKRNHRYRNFLVSVYASKYNGKVIDQLLKGARIWRVVMGEDNGRRYGGIKTRDHPYLHEIKLKFHDRYKLKKSFYSFKFSHYKPKLYKLRYKARGVNDMYVRENSSQIQRESQRKYLYHKKIYMPFTFLRPVHVLNSREFIPLNFSFEYSPNILRVMKTNFTREMLGWDGPTTKSTYRVIHKVGRMIIIRTTYEPRQRPKLRTRAEEDYLLKVINRCKYGYNPFFLTRYLYILRQFGIPYHPSITPLSIPSEIHPEHATNVLYKILHFGKLIFTKLLSDHYRDLALLFFCASMFWLMSRTKDRVSIGERQSFEGKKLSRFRKRWSSLVAPEQQFVFSFPKKDRSDFAHSFFPTMKESKRGSLYMLTRFHRATSDMVNRRSRLEKDYPYLRSLRIQFWSEFVPFLRRYGKIFRAVILSSLQKTCLFLNIYFDILRFNLTFYSGKLFLALLPYLNIFAQEIIKPTLEFLLRDIIKPFFLFFFKDIIKPFSKRILKPFLENVSEPFSEHVLEPVLEVGLNHISSFYTKIIVPFYKDISSIMRELISLFKRMLARLLVILSKEWERDPGGTMAMTTLLIYLFWVLYRIIVYWFRIR